MALFTDEAYVESYASPLDPDSERGKAFAAKRAAEEVAFARKRALIDAAIVDDAPVVLAAIDEAKASGKLVRVNMRDLGCYFIQSGWSKLMRECAKTHSLLETYTVGRIANFRIEVGENGHIMFVELRADAALREQRFKEAL